MFHTTFPKFEAIRLSLFVAEFVLQLASFNFYFNPQMNINYKQWVCNEIFLPQRSKIFLELKEALVS